MGSAESLYNTGFRRSRLTRRVRRLLAADLALVVGEEFGRDLSFKALVRTSVTSTDASLGEEVLNRPR